MNLRKILPIGLILFVICFGLLGNSTKLSAAVSPDSIKTEESEKGFIGKAWTWLEGVRTKIHDGVDTAYQKRLAQKEATEQKVADEHKDLVDKVLEGEQQSLVNGASDRVHPEQVFQSVWTGILHAIVVWSASQILFYGLIILIILACLWAVVDNFRN